MKTVYTRLLIFFVFVMLFSACCVGVSFKPISTTLKSISDERAEELLEKELRKLLKWKLQKEKYFDSTHIYLFDNPLVIDLYQNPYSHFKVLSKKIVDPTMEDEVKIMWIKLSQCLKDEDYLLLADKVLESSLNNNTKISLIKGLLSPGFEWGTRFDDNYHKPILMKFLERVSSEHNLGIYLAKNIDRIETGRNASFLEAYRSVDEQYPMLQCEDSN